MKKITSLLILVFCLSTAAFAQYTYEFTVVKQNPATPVKNQARTGTCWCFATTSFIESELMRMGKGEHDLSEMYIVRKVYEDRIADNYLRRGRGNLGPGSVAHIFTIAMDKYGLIPDKFYNGINYNSTTHNHSALQKYVNTISKTAVELKERAPKELIDGLLDAYLGKVPSKFNYNGKDYNAQSFYKSLGLNADDYVEITSFTHHPFYQAITVEVSDNWDYGKSYNLPLDEMMAVVDNAINNGYTVAWDGDVSEKSYNFSKLIALSAPNGLNDLKERVKEEPVTQESRQAMFENFTTTDDHLEHIVGIAKDQEGAKYYITKNSWGTERNGTGYHYMSSDYVKGKTIAFLVHKNSIPKEIRAKLGIK